MAYRGAGIICQNGTGQVLCVKGRESGKWGFPKGHREKGETLLSCAVREFSEEVGSKEQSLIKKLISVKKIFREKSTSTLYYRVDVDFPITIETKDTHEIEDVKWFSYEELRLFTRPESNIGLWSFIRTQTCDIEETLDKLQIGGKEDIEEEPMDEYTKYLLEQVQTQEPYEEFTFDVSFAVDEEILCEWQGKPKPLYKNSTKI